MNIVYSRDDCGWCVRAKQLLNLQGIEFQEWKLGVDYTRDDLAKLLNKTDRLTVPQIVLEGKLIGGYEDLKAYFENKEDSHAKV